MSKSIGIIKAPTFSSLRSIALENASLARNLGLLDDKFAGIKVGQGQQMTMAFTNASNTNAFWGDFVPNAYPSDWQ